MASGVLIIGCLFSSTNQQPKRSAAETGNLPIAHLRLVEEPRSSLRRRTQDSTNVVIGSSSSN